MNAETKSIDDQIKALGLTAPRVTPDQIERTIVRSQYHVFPDTTVTVCCLHLQNGFTVIGESACASPENFNAELGRRIAYDNAKQKIWALEGYALRERLSDLTSVKSAVTLDGSPLPGSITFFTR